MAPSICSERLRVLWIAPRWPFPTDDGAKRASVELLRPLSSRSSLEIDYVGLVARWTEPDLNPEALASIPLSSWRRIGRGSASAWLQKLRGLVKSFLLETSFPYSVQSFRDRALISEIESCFQKKSYDVCVIDGLHAAASLMAANGSQLRGTRVPLVLRAHNVESVIWSSSADRVSFPLRFLARAQSQKMLRFETRVLEAVQGVSAVSKHDEALLQALSRSPQFECIPIGFDFSKNPDPIPVADRVNLLFAASLDWEPNREGLLWFLNSVWPSCDRTRLQLHIAGRGAGKDLEEFIADAGGVFHGRVKDLGALYRDSQLCLSPLFTGSGTRVKIIESVQQGRPVLSTKLGAQGLPLDTTCAYLADTAQEWIDALSCFETAVAQSKANEAFLRLKGALNGSECADRLENFLQTLAKKSRPL